MLTHNIDKGSSFAVLRMNSFEQTWCDSKAKQCFQAEKKYLSSNELEARGKPSTWLPREALVEHLIYVIEIFV